MPRERLRHQRQQHRAWCIISGFWFVQSATYEELRKLNAANKG
ncbi:hypothetical protein [Pseudomonas kribbensis]|nr:hypothetical protein [Pseudomonas kribbensis]